MAKDAANDPADFWWLVPDEAKKFRFVYTKHQHPYSDQQNTDRDPPSVERDYSFYSVDSSGNLSKNEKRYPVEFLNKWKKRCGNTNVFRSLALFAADENADKLLGPLVLDIDREDYMEGEGMVQDLGKALQDTRKLVRCLQQSYRVKESDLCVLFTGHKGFNVEVRLGAVGIGSVNPQWDQFKFKRKEINQALGGSDDHPFVDRLHSFVRLHNSVNKWVACDGQEVARMKIQLTLDELFSLEATAIRNLSEDLVQASIL